MAPIKWQDILATQPEDINDDTVDDNYGILSNATIGKSDENVTVENLIHLFNVTQAVLNIKHETAETYLEELTGHAASEGQKSAKEELQLKEEVEELKKEITRLKSLGSSDVGKDARKLQQKLLDEEAKSERLSEELQDEVTQHESTKRKLERTEKDLVESEKNSKELKRENDQMREDMREFQRQMEAQRDTMLSKSGEDSDVRDLVRQKNQEMLDQLDEIRNLSLANKKLQEEVDELTKNLESSITEMEQMAAAHNKIKGILASSDVAVDHLTRMNEVLQDRVDELESELSGKRDGDEEIMAAVSNKIQEWKDLVAKKDEHIQEKEREVNELRSQLGISNVDLDRNSYASLQMALKAKDQDLQRMVEQMNEANNELEEFRQMFQDMKQDAGPNAKYLERINELKVKLQNAESDLKEAKEKQRVAERDSANKDRDMAEAEERLAQYEAGEYGLAEAVVEIKQLKQQIRIRDNNVEQLIGQMNKVELKMNSLWEENEALRLKCGMDAGEPVDLDKYQHQLDKRKQEDRAMNIILLNEVDKLENERIILKKQIRSLAMDKGQRAAALGLTADDIIKVDEFTEQLKANNAATHRTLNHSFFRLPKTEQPRPDETDFPLGNVGPVGDTEKQMDDLLVERNSLRTRCEQLQQDTRQLCDVIRELKNIKLAEVPDKMESVDSLLALLEARQEESVYDASVMVKARVDQLTGRNEELRTQMREVRTHNNRLAAENERLAQKAKRLEEDMQEMKEEGGGVVQLAQMTLPQGMSPSSSDVINSLNEHLILTLQELSKKESKLGEMEESVVKSRSALSVARHQVGLLYKDFRQRRQQWDRERQQLMEDKQNLEGLREADRIRIEEFKRLQESLSVSPDELKRELSEVNRRITVLRVNERALLRRLAMQSEAEKEKEAEVRGMRNEIVSMETCVMKRIGYLQRFKTMSLYRIEALQKHLQETVAESDYEKLQTELNKVTLKYRDLLEKENHLVAKSAAVELLQAEKQRLEETLEKTKREWTADKESVHKLQQLLSRHSNGSGSGSGSGKVGEQEDVSVVSKKMAMLEMKVVNDAQSTEHAQRMYEHQKKAMRDLEDRNAQLEQQNSTLTSKFLENTEVESGLREELSRCVSREAFRAVEKRLAEVEGVEARLRVESSKLKEMVEVANLQVSSISLMKQQQQTELEGMREMVRDMQKDSDQNKAIGKLHHDKINLQNKEGMLLMQLQQSKERMAKLDAQSLRFEQKLDEKDAVLYHCKLEARNRSMHLKKMIQDLRNKYAGCLPLDKQEKFSDALYSLHEERARLQKEVHDAQVKRISAEDQLMKVDVQHKALQELMETVRDNKGVAKVAEWHAKMTDMRLQELKSRREQERLKEKVRYLERLLQQQESTVATLEEQQVLAAKDQEQQQIYWEQREMELEKMVELYEQKTLQSSKWTAGGGNRSEQQHEMDHLPEPSLPVAEQLQFSVDKIRELVGQMGQCRNEAQLARKEKMDLESRVAEKESALLARDRIINELRLRMPAGSNRDDIMKDVLASDPHLQHATKVAQQLNDNLKSQLQQKSVEVSEYKALLSRARQELNEANEQHRSEVVSLHNKLAAATEESFAKFKHFTLGEMEGGNKGGGVVSEKELQRLAELEDMVAEQSNVIASLNVSLHDCKRHTEKVARDLNDQLHLKDMEIQRLVTERETEAQGVAAKLQQKQDEIDALQKEVDCVKMDLQVQKSENAKAPTTAMKSLVDTLKHELHDKDAKLKALSKALSDLRSQMVESAAESVKRRAKSCEDSLNVQQIVDKQTKQLQDELREKSAKVDKLKNIVRKCKEEEVHSQIEMQNLKEQLQKKQFELTNRPERDIPATPHRTADSPSLFHASGEEVGVKVARAVKEEANKWQLKVDSIKDKLRLKTAECERLCRSNTLLKENLARLDKERVSKIVARDSGTVSSATQKQLLDSLEATRRQNLELHDEVASLKRQALLGKDGALEELRLRNRILSQKVDELQEELSLRTPRKGKGGEGGGGLQDAYARLIEREEQLQENNLRLAQENIELKFQAEQAKMEMPKLMTKIEELQRQVEVLNSELYDKPVKERKVVGTTGKTVAELERTIGLMKKVMERTEGENERLKKLPSVASNARLEELQTQNQCLKEELAECRRVAEREMRERYEALQVGTSRLTAENERLLLEIQKEREANEEATAKTLQLQQQLHKLQQQQQTLGRKKDPRLQQQQQSSLSSTSPVASSKKK